MVRERFGVDADTCTGDHSCIRLSGCPSLTISANPDPLRKDPVATVLDSCVGCGLCGEVAHAAVLCPSFLSRGNHLESHKLGRIQVASSRAVIGFCSGASNRRLAGSPDVTPRVEAMDAGHSHRSRHKPLRSAITIAILAMGGEGGGVLADWIVDLAEHAGYLAQTTSVPGVAQRTGSTIYYLEIFPSAAARQAKTRCSR